MHALKYIFSWICNTAEHCITHCKQSVFSFPLSPGWAALGGNWILTCHMFCSSCKGGVQVHNVVTVVVEASTGCFWGQPLRDAAPWMLSFSSLMTRRKKGDSYILKRGCSRPDLPEDRPKKKKMCCDTHQWNWEFPDEVALHIFPTPFPGPPGSLLSQPSAEQFVLHQSTRHSCHTS